MLAAPLIWRMPFGKYTVGAERSPAEPAASGGPAERGISAGQFLAIATQSTPLAREPWGLSNQMTARTLDSIGKAGGPRCCKRNSWLSILAAIDFVQEHLGVKMERTVPICAYSQNNHQCIGKLCPFSPANRTKPKVAFVCVHNSCRSQIAEALGKQLAADVFESYSAGTEPKPKINPDAVRLMKQICGIDLEETQYSKLLSDLPPVDLVVTMGCGVQCPVLPCSHREDWGLEDPSGKGDKAFEAVIAAIQEKILNLKHPHPNNRYTYSNILGIKTARLFLLVQKSQAVFHLILTPPLRRAIHPQVPDHNWLAPIFWRKIPDFVHSDRQTWKGKSSIAYPLAGNLRNDRRQAPPTPQKA